MGGALGDILSGSGMAMGANDSMAAGANSASIGATDSAAQNVGAGDSRSLQGTGYKAIDTVANIANKTFIDPAQKYLDEKIIAKDANGNIDGWKTAENTAVELIKAKAGIPSSGGQAKTTSQDDDSNDFYGYRDMSHDPNSPYEKQKRALMGI